MKVLLTRLLFNRSKPKHLHLWVVLGATFLYGCQSSNHAPQSPLGTVQKELLIQKVTLTGTLIPKRKSIILPPFNGYIKKIFVSLGQNVIAGDPLITFAQSLNDNPEDLHPIRAPFSGKIVQISRSEGEYLEPSGVQSNTGALRLDDLSQIYIESGATEFDIVKLKPQQTALVKVTALQDREYHAKIMSLDLASKDSQTWGGNKSEYAVKLLVEDPDSDLKPGLSVLCDIIVLKLEDALTLKHEYIRQDKKGSFVILESGKRKDIVVGQMSDSLVQVKSGLQLGDRVKQNNFLDDTHE